MTRPVQTLLLVEDFAPDRELYRRCLLSDSEVAYSVLEAESVMAGLALCQESAIDAVLLDYALPDGDGIEFLQALHAQNNGNSPPVVMVTGAGSERLAVQAIKLGAEDYLAKQDLTPELLQVTMRSAIENARLRLQLQHIFDRFRVSIENMLDCFGIFSAIRDASGRIIDFRFDYLNAAAMKDTQLTATDLGRAMCVVFPAHHETGLFADYCRVVETGEPLAKENLIYSDTFGTQSLTRAYDIRASKLGDGLAISWRNVTERKQSELALQEANQQITEIWESMTDAYVTLDREWRVVYANSAATHVYRQLTGLEPEEFLGKSHWEIFPSLVGSSVEQAYRQAVAEQVALHFEVFYEPTGGWFETHAYPSTAGLGIYFRDISERKQAEAIVQQQLAEIEAIYATAPVGLCFVDTDLRFIRINERLAEINGLPILDHLGRTLREILPEMADQLEPLYRQVIESGEPVLNLEVEGTNRAQPSKLRQWSVCYYPQKDLHQHVVGVNVMVQEITDRKQLEAEREQVKAERDRFFELSSDLLMIGTLNGLFLQINPAWTTTLGWSQKELTTRNYIEFVHPDDIAATRHEAEKVAQGGTVLNFENRYRCRDGSYRWLSWNVVVEQDDFMYGVARDISDRIHNEQRLRDSEERLKLGVQVAGVALAKFDYASNTVELSPEAAALYGIPADELVVTRDRIHATFHPDEREEMARIIERVTVPDGDGWFARDHRVVWQTGEVRWLSVRKQVFFDRSGSVARPHYAILAAIDITDRKEAELERSRLLAEAEAAREEAEAANRSKDEFVAVVAHELRSPLNSIAGWSKLLQSRKVDEATLSKALDTIWRNTQAQVQLVEDLLDISRMVRGALQITLAPVNWVNVIEAALEIVRPMADAKHIQIETHLTLTPQISGDFNRLQQIAVNLLTNAIKFTPEGGRVAVHLRQEDAQVVLQVHDTGKGIAPEFLPQVFERYKQGQNNAGAKDGLGLGLAIVKNLVELHGGTIQAESAGIGAGATFTVRLPRLEAPAIQPESFVVDPTSLAGVRILAVDDDPDMLNLIAFVLQDFGAEVQAVMTADTALECLSQFKPNILLSDLAMPEGDGCELMQQIKSYPEGKIPAIALTAYASATHRERSRLAGFQKHLTKPVDPEDLIAAILSLVRGEAS